METEHGTRTGETVHYHSAKWGLWVIEYAPGTPCSIRTESVRTINETTRVVYFMEGANGSSSGSVKSMVAEAKSEARRQARKARELAEG